jgi:hypothetical protein
MTKSEKMKLGLAAGIGVVAIFVLIWYFFLSAPPGTTTLEPVPEGSNVPNRRVPTGS